LPKLEVDEPLRYEERRVRPRLGLRVRQKREHWGEEFFEGRMLVEYGLGWMEQTGGNRWVEAERVLVVRDAQAEGEGEAQLRAAGLRPMEQHGLWRVSVKNMPKAVRDLLLAGWHVEAEGKAFRKPGASRLAVSSGVDWFDLEGEVDYDGVTATLPELLAALRRGEMMVRLGDGTYGLLPEEWLAKLGTIAGMGEAEEGKLRYRRGQAGLLDALLAAQPEATCDEAFARLRERLASFRGIQAAEQPEGFEGTLRGYQKEGLGWIGFLREYGFGGCLADDMGVGKTAQVLAALEQRRVEGAGPSLVVAPKSLMFNWKEEATRFTPGLRVLEHTGLERDAGRIGDYDLVLTTYGTLRRDVVEFKDIEFDYVVLDEAQAIKNAATESAKAARLLRGRHKLALSGTPVENHLGELWSLFEFLNPGMLGEAKALKLTGGLARNPDAATRTLLAHALRPFILRRTKKQVASELPEKTEQTIFCEMEPRQRRQYDELKKHYRDSLLGRIEKQGMAKSKMHVLEALLRLRQAACHPGLLDAKRRNEPSAKLDELMERIAEIREEGSKALVFSQFTSLLDLVRERLVGRGLDFEYLDGSTRDRRAPVERFQKDPGCGLFLISLKAGGLGLNLTAAEYVFLLDPWWNPAVEAQAVDRAHRIGQTRNVFAYRLIARGTVEEKVLELQKSKRDLADAIIGEDNSLLRDLKREDLELLLS
jgi:SNF2 family DNA or RNA helicase